MTSFKSFVDIVYSTRDRALLEDFLVAITTDAERKELARRLEITRRLVAGIPQLKIANDMGVGVATVTRGSKELNAGRFKVLRKKSK